MATTGLSIRNKMNHTLRCHDFGELSTTGIRHVGRPLVRYSWAKIAPATRGAAGIDGAPQREAGIGATRSRGPLAGCDREADREARRTHADPLRIFGVTSPEGPLFQPSTRPWGCDREGACKSRGSARSCPATGSHPSTKRLEPAPPCAGRFVGRLADILDIGCVVLRAIVNSNSRRTCASFCYGLLGDRKWKTYGTIADRAFAARSSSP